jgi:hypothetical protein
MGSLTLWIAVTVSFASFLAAMRACLEENTWGAGESDTCVLYRRLVTIGHYLTLSVVTI